MKFQQFTWLKLEEGSRRKTFHFKMYPTKQYKLIRRLYSTRVYMFGRGGSIANIHSSITYVHNITELMLNKPYTMG